MVLMKTTNFPINTVPEVSDIDLVDALTNYLEQGKLPKRLKYISKETLTFIIDDSNRQKVVETALNNLKKTDKNATTKQAEFVADNMIRFSQLLIDKRNSKQELGKGKPTPSTD
jgi:hypothetical protein